MLDLAEQIVEGNRVCDKVLGLRALFGIKISNPIYNTLPPPGPLLAYEVLERLEEEKEHVDKLLGDLEKLEAAVDAFQRHLMGEDAVALEQRGALAIAVSKIDDITKETADRSVAHKLQQFRVKYDEDAFSREVWQPGGAGSPGPAAYTATMNFMKQSLLPAVRNNPQLKLAVSRTESPDLDIHRLVLKRHSVKTKGVSTSGVRGLPRSARLLSKQRELKFDVIPALVHFMPKLSAFEEAKAQAEDTGSESDSALPSDASTDVDDDLEGYSE